MRRRNLDVRPILEVLHEAGKVRRAAKGEPVDRENRGSGDRGEREKRGEEKEGRRRRREERRRVLTLHEHVLPVVVELRDRLLDVAERPMQLLLLR